MTRTPKYLLDYSTALWITSAKLGINSRMRVAAPNRADPPVWGQGGRGRGITPGRGSCMV